MKKRGFTLIEIVVVAAIIGVLAALLLPKLSGQTQKAKEKKAKVEMVQTATALSMVKLDNPSVTKYCKLQDLDNPASSPPTQDAEGNSATFSNWNGPYMVFNDTSKGANTSVPDDPWGNDYLLDISTVSTDGYALLRCYGKDGVGGNSDDITHKFF